MIFVELSSVTVLTVYYNLLVYIVYNSQKVGGGTRAELSDILIGWEFWGDLLK